MITSIDDIKNRIGVAREATFQGQPLTDEIVAALFGAQPQNLAGPIAKKIATRANKGGAGTFREFALSQMRNFKDLGEPGLGVRAKDAINFRQ